MASEGNGRQPPLDPRLLRYAAASRPFFLAIAAIGLGQTAAIVGFAALTTHCWLGPPWQSQIWSAEPSVTPSPVMSRHLPSARTVPSLPNVHCCAPVPLQS